MLNILFLEVLIPVDDQLFTEKVCFVYEQQELLFAFTHLVNIFLKVCRVEKIGVSGIDDLQHHCQYINLNLPESEDHSSR